MIMPKRVNQIQIMCRPFLKPFLIISLLVTATQSMGVIFAVYMGKYVKGVDEHDMTAVNWSLFALLLAILGGKLLDWQLIRIHIRKIITDLEGHISVLTIQRITKLSIGQVINQNSGFKQETLQKGESAIGELVGTFFLELIPTVSRIVITLVALFWIDFGIGYCALASIVFYIWSSIKINNKLLPRIKINKKKENKLNTSYWEMIKHVKLVIASAQEKRAVTEFSARQNEYGEEHKDIWAGYTTKLTFTREPFVAFGHVLILWLAAANVMNNEMSKSSLIAVMGLIALGYSALGSVGNTQRRLVRNYILMGRYFDLLDLPPAVKVKKNALKLGSFERSIEFRNVSFKYPEFKLDDSDEDKPDPQVEKEKLAALGGINLTINRGEIVALVGPSGSGKSTFIGLLQRGYDPDSGQILIDGHDLRDLDLDRWKEMLGLVDQEPKLWDETLRYNILYGLNGHGSEVSQRELEKLAAMTRIDEFYPRLHPKGFDTLIGENGLQLSGGQRQRVAIARALIKKPDLLILDEATNALDPYNEKLVHQAIRASLKGRTGIIIAHRLSTIRTADKIVVFSKGSIIGLGTHAELMNSCSQYNELVKHELEGLH